MDSSAGAAAAYLKAMERDMVAGLKPKLSLPGFFKAGLTSAKSSANADVRETAKLIEGYLVDGLEMTRHELTVLKSSMQNLALATADSVTTAVNETKEQNMKAVADFKELGRSVKSLINSGDSKHQLGMDFADNVLKAGTSLLTAIETSARLPEHVIERMVLVFLVHLQTLLVNHPYLKKVLSAMVEALTTFLETESSVAQAMAALRSGLENNESVQAEGPSSDPHISSSQETAKRLDQLATNLQNSIAELKKGSDNAETLWETHLLSLADAWFKIEDEEIRDAGSKVAQAVYEFFKANYPNRSTST